jgi:hypothetical protein
VGGSWQAWLVPRAAVTRICGSFRIHITPTLSKADWRGTASVRPSNTVYAANLSARWQQRPESRLRAPISAQTASFGDIGGPNDLAALPHADLM